MNVEAFDRIKKEFADHEDELLHFKRGEYAGIEDVLANFKDVSAFLGMIPRLYCMALFGKHMGAIIRAVRSKEPKRIWCWRLPSGEEGLKQRIADARNYLLLLAAIIDEEDPPA